MTSSPPSVPGSVTAKSPYGAEVPRLGGLGSPRNEINEGVRAALSQLDGSSASAISLLTGVPVDQLQDYGGMPPTEMWFIAICHRCAPDFGQPFGDEGERDGWAAEHATATGHVVQMLVEVAHAELGGHTTAMLRFEDGRGWWLCTAEPCVRWNGPYVSAQLAAASFRSHRAGRSS